MAISWINTLTIITAIVGAITGSFSTIWIILNNRATIKLSDLDIEEQIGTILEPYDNEPSSINLKLLVSNKSKPTTLTKVEIFRDSVKIPDDWVFINNTAQGFPFHMVQGDSCSLGLTSYTEKDKLSGKKSKYQVKLYHTYGKTSIDNYSKKKLEVIKEKIKKLILRPTLIIS